ncbi:MAG: hypothetical protein V9H25_20710 [Candidatus Competibacter sp.]
MKNFKKRDAAVEDALQDHDIDPGSMVGADQIPVVAAQPLQPSHVPFDALGQVQDGVVALDPGFGQADQRAGMKLAPAGPGAGQLEQHHPVERQAPKHRVQDEQD